MRSAVPERRRVFLRVCETAVTLFYAERMEKQHDESGFCLLDRSVQFLLGYAVSAYAPKLVGDQAECLDLGFPADGGSDRNETEVLETGLKGINRIAKAMGSHRTPSISLVSTRGGET